MAPAAGWNLRTRKTESHCAYTAVVPEGIPGASAGTSLMDLVDNYRLLAPALDQIAAWQGTGKLRSALPDLPQPGVAPGVGH